jgi:hypothetical protein
MSYFPKINRWEDGMSFKKINKEFSFADVVLESSKKNNRSIQKMRRLNKSISCFYLNPHIPEKSGLSK